MTTVAHRAGITQGRGFTLIEVVIILAILSIMMAMVVPMVFQLFTAERARALEEELQQIHTAIVGNPEKGLYGYVGDVGSYPKSLLDLVLQPRDASGNPLPGWKGPYVQNARTENGVWLDPLGRAYEYYVVSGSNGPDQLAILSRGNDGLSTNTSATPNATTTYVGPSPADAGYAGGTSNADNVVFPRAEGNPHALNIKTDGDVAFNILNWDNNKEVNTFVPACPELFTITATSVARGTVEASTRHVPGLAFNLAQGQYRITIAPQGLSTTSRAETITVQPGSTLTRTLNLTGLDSSGTPLFNLTVKNGFTSSKLEIYEFDTKLDGKLPGQASGAKSSIDEGETRVFTSHACAQIYVRKKGKSDVVDQFVMPYGPFTRQEGAEVATLFVTNLHGHAHHDHANGNWHHHGDDHHHRPQGSHRLFVHRNDILLGTVNHHGKDKEFKDLLAGDRVTVFDRGGALLAGLTVVAGTNSVRVGS